MINTIIKKSTENTMLTFGTDVAHQVTDALANKYGFDPEEAKEFLGTLTLSNSSIKQKVKVPSVPLPFCGKIEESWCQAIKSNHKMFTQCRNDKVYGIFCKGCATNAKKNEGKPTYGVIQDRLNKDYTDKNGKKPKNYGNVMKTLDITREAAEAEAKKLGWTIPEEQFNLVVTKPGRKKGSKTTTSSSDNEQEVKDEEVQDEEVKDEEDKDEEVQDEEDQDEEDQDEEVQDEEVQDEEVQDDEVQDEEVQDEEVQDEEVQEEEVQEEEVQEEEVQEEEVQEKNDVKKVVKKKDVNKKKVVKKKDEKKKDEKKKNDKKKNVKKKVTKKKTGATSDNTAPPKLQEWDNEYNIDDANFLYDKEGKGPVGKVTDIDNAVIEFFDDV